MRSIRWKLAGALLLIVVVSVGLMAFMANLSTTREFRQYLSHSSTMYNESVGESLSQFYQREGGWTGVNDTLTSLLRSTFHRLVLVDSSGVVVGDTE